MSSDTNTSTANGNTHAAAAPAAESQLRNVVPRLAASTNSSVAATEALATAWELRSHVVGRVSGGDLVWLALAFPAALAGPCVAQLRAAHRSACEPPEAADAAACDALVGAVARGHLGDARALLGGPLGPSLLRWRSAGRAAELMLIGLLQSAFGACPNCPERARLTVASETDLVPDQSSSTIHWRCSMCYNRVQKKTDRVARDNALLVRCTCGFKLCCTGLDGWTNSLGRPVFYGANNSLGGIFCGSVLDDRAPRAFKNGFLCGLESGNECSACHELHRRILDDRVISKCCLGIVGIGYPKQRVHMDDDYDNGEYSYPSTVYWSRLLSRDDWTTRLQQPLPARLFFLACALGMAQSLRIMVQKPLCLDRASAVDGHDLKYYKDALLFAALRREGWIEHQQPKAIGRGGFVDVVRAMLQPPLTPAELSRPRMRTLLLWSLKLAEEDVHEIVSLLMAPPVSLTAEQCFEDRFFVEKVAESELSMDVLSRSQLGIEKERWACWLKENAVRGNRDEWDYMDGEDYELHDFDTRPESGERLVRLFE
eukprot:m51a1_g14414 hypothetical protein (542) ;mRNA; r:448443-450913